MSKMLRVPHGTKGVNPGIASFKGKSRPLRTVWITLLPLKNTGPIRTQKISNTRKPSRIRKAG